MIRINRRHAQVAKVAKKQSFSFAKEMMQKERLAIRLYPLGSAWQCSVAASSTRLF